MFRGGGAGVGEVSLLVMAYFWNSLCLFELGDVRDSLDSCEVSNDSPESRG